MRKGPGPWIALRLEEDWEYDCRIAAVGGRLVYCPFPVSETRDHVSDRLCRGESLDPTRLAMRAEAHTLVWEQAKRAELPDFFPEDVARFGQALFLLARQCGAAGLGPQSRSLLTLASKAATRGRAKYQVPIYRAVASVLGFQQLGKIVNWSEQLRMNSKREF
jgi:alkylhydroperoxidase/carboxymuconolactone decarboxylase family protein YurZ